MDMDNLNLLSVLAVLLLLLGVVFGNLLLLLVGLGLLGYSAMGSSVCADNPTTYVGLPEAPGRAPAVAPPAVVPVDRRQPRVSSTAALEPSLPGSFVHVPLYQETSPYERQTLDAAFAHEAITRNAVNPPIQPSSKRVEFVQFLNEGRGPCRKDHWMVQVDEPTEGERRAAPPPPPPPVAVVGGAETTS